MAARPKKRKTEADIGILQHELESAKKSAEKLIKIIKQTSLLSFEWCEYCDKPIDSTIDCSSAGMICQSCNADLPCKTWCKILRKQKRFLCYKHTSTKYCEDCVTECTFCSNVFCRECMSEQEVPTCIYCIIEKQ